VNSIYRSTAGREAVRRWCADRLAAWPVPHERRTVMAQGARTHIVAAGEGATTVVFVAGTNFNATTSLPLATALVAEGHRVLLMDMPGQPGLSTGERALSGGRLTWHGSWLDAVLAELAAERLVVMGHSFGAAIVLSSRSPRIERHVLLSPGGLTRLRLTPQVLAASTGWFLRRTPHYSARLLTAMLAPGHRPGAELVDWMTLVARHVRSSRAPESVTLPVPRIPRLAISGEHDVFLPPRRLGPTVRRALGVELEVLPDVSARRRRARRRTWSGCRSPRCRSWCKSRTSGGF